MANRLVIYIDFASESDLEYWRTRVIGGVEDFLIEQRHEEEVRFDGEPEVNWDIEND